ncbi:hypothetical protein HS121_02015 [bacterium]|nr:hypothetical protein [bacterium]
MIRRQEGTLSVSKSGHDDELYCQCNETDDGVTVSGGTISLEETDTIPLSGHIYQNSGQECGCSGISETYKQATGYAHIYDPFVTVTELQPVCARINGATQFNICWNTQDAPPTVSCGGLQPRVIWVYITLWHNGSDRRHWENEVMDWAGCVYFNGNLNEDGETLDGWDGTSEVTITIHLAYDEVLPYSASSFGCTCQYHESAWDDEYIIPAECGCTGEGGGPCGGGSSGGNASSSGANVCKLGQQEDGFPFYDYSRHYISSPAINRNTLPFGTGSPFASDTLFKYVMMDGNWIKYYEGGRYVNSIKEFYNSGGTKYVNSSGEIVATVVTINDIDYLDWEMGSIRYRFVKPSSGVQFVKTITDLETNRVLTFNYNQPNGELAFIDPSDSATNISLVWEEPNYDHLSSITFPGGWSEIFEYTSGNLSGIRESYNGTLLGYTTWTETNDRVTQIVKHALTSPFGAVATNDFAYDAETGLMTSFERYSNAYTIDYSPDQGDPDWGSKKKKITAPDGSSVKYDTSSSNSTYTIDKVTTYERTSDGNSQTSYSETTTTNATGLLYQIVVGTRTTTYTYTDDLLEEDHPASRKLYPVYFNMMPPCPSRSRKTSNDTELAYTQYDDYDGETAS